MRLKAALLASAVLACHANFAAAGPLKIGSRNEAVIEPPISHPDEKPCVVPLYKNAQFGANSVDFAYTPPASCPGPYATVVLSVDVSLDKGIQYDRTGTIFFGGVPLWFGTTAEPDPSLAPAWHFERNVTNYTSLFAAANSGFVLITNYTNSTDTSIITSSAKLLFYPATASFPAPNVPDVVIPLAAPGGGTVALNTGKDELTIEQKLPTNIHFATLDVYTQGQSADEFWYTCVPTKLSSELESCPGGSFREGEVKVDGMPAGVAPVYPWIFTGGIDPYLWQPIPGVQTLNFKPFPVNLSPFAAVLSDGTKKHKIALSVHGAANYFSATGALLLYLDPNTTQVTGGITQNTLAAKPTTKITNTLTNSGGVISGGLNTSAQHSFTISGTITTAAGTQQYTVSQIEDFENDQTFLINDSVYKQLIRQTTSTTVQTTGTTSAGTSTNVGTYYYPLNVELVEKPTSSGDISLKSTIAQAYNTAFASIADGVENTNTLDNSINTTDTLLFNSAGTALVGHHGQASTAKYATSSTTAACFGRTLTAAKNVLTGVATGCQK